MTTSDLNHALLDLSKKNRIRLKPLNEKISSLEQDKNSLISENKKLEDNLSTLEERLVKIEQTTRSSTSTPSDSENQSILETRETQDFLLSKVLKQDKLIKWLGLLFWVLFGALLYLSFK